MVADTSHIGQLRRAVRDLALVIGMSSDLIAKAELVATELATNLLKHVDKGGEILLGSVTVDDSQGLELISLDSGTGMANPQLMLEDGVSTTGTLGGGLGAVKRLSDEFDIYSKPGSGTAILSRVWTARAMPAQENEIEIGGITVPKPGENVSGDRWAVRANNSDLTIVLSDGLGHGQKAALASEECLRVFFDAHPIALRPSDLLRKMHEAVRHTQGAAVAIAQVRPLRNETTYSAIGNISTRIALSAGNRSCASMPGGVGFQLSRVQEFTYPWSDRALLTMSSDGLHSDFNTVQLAQHHPSLIAAVIYKDFRRGTDDAAIVIGKDKRVHK